MTINVMRAWDKGRNKIAYVYRNPETGKAKLGETKFQNWFYIKLEDFEKHRSIFYNLKEDRQIVDFETVNKYVKIFIDTVHNDELLDREMQWVWEYKNYNLNKLMDKLAIMGVQTYEADVKAYKRWLLQDDVKIETQYKVLYYDIETDDRHADGLTPGKYRILSIAAKASDSNNVDGKMFWICLKEDTDEAEKEMLTKFAKLVNRHDVLISFNGMNFDDPYVKSRFVRYGIDIDWRKVFLQDHCWTFKKYGPSLTSNSLENISRYVLGRGKVDHTGVRIWDMWQTDRALLKEYNIEDVQLMYEIECKTGFLGAHRDICAEGMCSVDDLFVSRKIDNFILKQAEEDNEFHFKTMEWQEKTDEENEITFEGAFVFPPVPGRHVSVKVVDFGSLYPNIINTFNISPDTFIEKGVVVPPDKIITTPNGYNFRKDFIGILPKVVMRLTSKREYYKGLMSKEVPGTMMYRVYDRMQYLYKYFGLSFYGCMGEKHGRTYDIRIAETVTLTGQYFTKRCAEYCQKQGLKITYGDTDSLFLGGLRGHNTVQKLANKLSELCEAHAKRKFNCDICTIVMEYDKGFKTFIALEAKKRYAGVLDYLDGHTIEDFSMYVAGLEYKRTDGCKILKEKQYEMLKNLLQDEECPDIGEIRQFILDLKDAVFSGKLTVDDIQVAERITKELDDYIGRQMHVTVAREMLADGKEVWIGDKVPYFIIGLDSNKKPIAKPAYKFEGKYCESYYWNNKIFPGLQRILDVVYPNVDWDGYRVKGSGEVKTGRTDLW